MKEIMAIIRPKNYFATKKALIDASFNAASVREVLGRGKQRVVYNPAAGEEGKETVGIEFVAKELMDIYARDEDVQAIVDIIMEVNHQGCPGDGKIFVLPADNAIRLHTGEQGDDVLV
ncbi:MAG: P-II family nitrogen regulator [Selenomonas sp.]|nr:P-II family nitrogen regulator [Selenomonas sp.]